MQEHKTVDRYIAKHGDQREATILLRELVKAIIPEETVKWGFPVYMINNKNVVGLGAFKAYTGIWFFQGGLLKDSGQKLVNAQEGKTKAMRQWRFNSADEITANSELIQAYLQEALENEIAGKAIKPDRSKSKPLVIPKELQEALDNIEGLKESFGTLSLSNRKDFAEHIDKAKRAETKLKRLDKIIPMISRGEGLNDKYKR